MGERRDQHFVNGRWVESAGPLQVVTNPSTEEQLAEVQLATSADVDAAVAAARRAFPAWSTRPVAERAAYLASLRDALSARMTELASLIADEVGSPQQFALLAQTGAPIAVAGHYVQLADTFEFESRSGNKILRREPAGVVAAITPWNYPLHQIICKLAPAFVSGCTVVWKPTEVAPLTSFVLAEILEEIELPAGVFNLVPGTGPDVGEALASHPDVDLVSFTGSTRAGTRVAELAAPSVTRVALELGGEICAGRARRRRPRSSSAVGRVGLFPQQWANVRRVDATRGAPPPTRRSC